MGLRRDGSIAVFLRPIGSMATTSGWCSGRSIALDLKGSQTLKGCIVRIIVLRTGDALPPVAEKNGEFFDFIKRTVGDTWAHDWESLDVRVPDVALPDPETAAAFIITGSASSVTERAPWMLRTEEYVRRIVAAEVPLLGICFGHQLIGQALGGEVAKNPRGREIGTVRLEVSEDDPILEGQPRTFDVQATHSDTVVRLPPGARVHRSRAEYHFLRRSPRARRSTSSRDG